MIDKPVKKGQHATTRRFEYLIEHLLLATQGTTIGSKKEEAHFVLAHSRSFLYNESIMKEDHNMAVEEHVKRLQQGTSVWNAWREENPDETIDLSYAVLSYAKLSNYNLSKANLIGTYFIGTDLSNADLTETYLISANLSRAKLVKADLSRANLSNAKLSEANLIGADLSNTNLSNAVLRNSDLSNADFSSAE